MANGFKFKLYGNITNRFFGQTTTIERARDLARFFLESEIRIEGKGIREVLSFPVKTLQTSQSESTPTIDQLFPVLDDE